MLTPPKANWVNVKSIAQAENVVNHEEGEEEEVADLSSHWKSKLNVGISGASDTRDTV